MDDGRQLGLSARVDIHRTAHDHRRHRQSADQSGGHVAHPLRDQFSVRRRDASLRVEFVDRFEVQQRLERGHERRSSPPPTKPVGLANAAEVRKLKKAEESSAGSPPPELAPDASFRSTIRRPAASAAGCMPTPNSTAANGPGTGDCLSHFDPLPSQQQGDRQQTDQGRAGMNVEERFDQLRERVFLVGLLERHLPFGIFVVAEQMGNLLENQESHRWRPADP